MPRTNLVLFLFGLQQKEATFGDRREEGWCRRRSSQSATSSDASTPRFLANPRPRSNWQPSNRCKSLWTLLPLLCLLLSLSHTCWRHETSTISDKESCGNVGTWKALNHQWRSGEFLFRLHRLTGCEAKSAHPPRAWPSFSTVEN